MKRQKKMIIGGVIGFAIFIILAIIAIFVGSIFAVSNFRERANRQFNPIIADNKTNVVNPTKLTAIPMANLLNSTYKRVKAAQPAYRKLLNDARKYNLIK